MPCIEAAVCHFFGEPFVIKDIEIRTPIDGKVEVNLATCPICHSDITKARDYWVGYLRAVYGHEAVGTVTAIGLNAEDVRIGDKVVVTLIRSCGTYLNCSAARPTNCEETYDGDQGTDKTANGGKLHQEMACGGFAEKVVVNESQVVVMPDGISIKEALLVAYRVITNISTFVDTSKVHPSQDVVVIGAGGVGLNAIKRTKVAGVLHIVAIGMKPSKLTIVREFEATDGLLVSTDEPWNEAKGLMERDADAITVDLATVYDQASFHLAKGGDVIIVSMPSSNTISNYEEANCAASGQGMIEAKISEVVIKHNIPWMVDLYTQGLLKLDELVSGTWSLDQINKAIADTKTGVPNLM
jgi:S-(hydroxymethyl)glutathione dehydrogenase/alcohol dehydrogenase